MPEEQPTIPIDATGILFTPTQFDIFSELAATYLHFKENMQGDGIGYETDYWVKLFGRLAAIDTSEITAINQIAFLDRLHADIVAGGASDRTTKEQIFERLQIARALANQRRQTANRQSPTQE